MSRNEPMYTELPRNWTSRGTEKFRRRRKCKGRMGESAARSAATNAVNATGATAMQAMTKRELQPHTLARFTASIAEATPTVRSTEPAMSKRGWTSGRRPGRSHAPRINAAAHSGTWATKIQRHEKCWTTGPPATTPKTGAPAPTNDHHPMARTRSRAGNESIRMAMLVGPAAAPTQPPTMRKVMRLAAFHETAMSTAATASAAKPTRYRRLWPKRSPSLPSVGWRMA